MMMKDFLIISLASFAGTLLALIVVFSVAISSVDSRLEGIQKTLTTIDRAVGVAESVVPDDFGDRVSRSINKHFGDGE